MKPLQKSLTDDDPPSFLCVRHSLSRISQVFPESVRFFSSRFWYSSESICLLSSAIFLFFSSFQSMVQLERRSIEMRKKGNFIGGFVENYAVFLIWFSHFFHQIQRDIKNIVIIITVHIAQSGQKTPTMISWEMTYPLKHIPQNARPVRIFAGQVVFENHPQSAIRNRIG